MTERRKEKERPPIPYDSMVPMAGTVEAVQQHLEIVLRESLTTLGSIESREATEESIRKVLKNICPIGVLIESVKVDERGEAYITMSGQCSSINIELDLSKLINPVEEVSKPITFIEDLKNL